MYKLLTCSRIRVEDTSPAYLGMELFKYFANYTRLAASHMRVELASPACLVLGMIEISILPYITV